MRVGVVNARFIKPLDRLTICKVIEECGFLLTVEESSLMGGFGSAVLEVANEAGLSTTHVRRLGLPDRYVLHAERDEQLAEVGLDVDGIMRAASALAMAVGWSLQKFTTSAKTRAVFNLPSPPVAKPGIRAGNEQSALGELLCGSLRWSAPPKIGPAEIESPGTSKSRRDP
jgi:Transketolase, C-terminal domain